MLSPFIGMKGNGIDNNFQWIDGTKPDVTYTNWAPKEPNYLKSEKCVEMRSFKKSDRLEKWNNIACSIKRPYICKKHEITVAYENGMCPHENIF